VEHKKRRITRRF